MPPSENRREVVLVGGGHAHVQVLRAFEMDPLPNASLTVVLDVPVAVYSGMVPGFVAGQYRRDELEIDVVPLARRANARVILSAATAVDVEKKSIVFADRPPIPYDIASLDIGSTVAGLHLPGVGEHALPTRPISGFVNRVEELVQRAELQGAESPFRVVIVGAGAGGVELAFTLEKRLRDSGARPEVTLLHAGPRILLGYPDSLVKRARRSASDRGITIRTESRVVAADAHIARLEDGSELPFEALVWVTGATAHRMLRESKLVTDSRGFVRTRSTLQVEGADDLFAVGDCGTLIDYPETPKAGVYAVRQGPVVAANLRRRLLNEPLEAYRPQGDFLTLLNLGDGTALGAKWGISFEGRWVMRLKDSIDRTFMRRFQVLESDGRLSGAFADQPRMSDDDAMQCGGCAAKLGREPLSKVLARLPAPPSEATGDDVVDLGLSAPDDAAIWHTENGAKVVSSVDLFSAFADDAYLVGRVAAINAVSDVWAMGAEPRVAHAIVALPEKLHRDRAGQTLFEVLAGARHELDHLGVALVGGHTTTAPEKLLVGFSIEGELTGAELFRKGGLKPGDALILTKPLGTGVVLQANMQGRARGAWVQAAVASMLRPNRTAAAIAAEIRPSAMTDVTGFGLAGHLWEMLAASGVTADVALDEVAALPGSLELLAQGLRSTFHQENERLRHGLRIDDASVNDPRLSLLFDPQTSGGLLFGVAAAAADGVCGRLRENGDHAATIIGRVSPPREDGVMLQIVPTLETT